MEPKNHPPTASTSHEALLPYKVRLYASLIIKHHAISKPESIDPLAALVGGTHHHCAHGQISELEDAGAGAGAGAGGCGGGGGGGGGHGNTGKR